MGPRIVSMGQPKAIDEQRRGQLPSISSRVPEARARRQQLAQAFGFLRKPQTYLRIHMLADVFDIFCVNSQRQQGGHVQTNLHVDSAEKVRVTKA